MSALRKKKGMLPERDATLVRSEQLLANPTAESIDFALEYSALVDSYRHLHNKFHKTLLISDSYQQETKELTRKLEETLQDFQKLKEVALPICMVCNKIRTTNDYWVRLEEFFTKHADIMFSHGICPDCVRVTYGQLGEKVLARKKAAFPGVDTPNHPDMLHEPQEDETLLEMRSLAELAASSNNPLTAKIEKITRRYAKFLKRFNKIVTLGDSYQSQLREFNKRLELMAHTDPLTGINNRGYFLELLAREIERAKRYGHLFCVLMLDLDKFKAVNDTFGHAAGDEALRTLIRILTSSGLRQSDFFGRIGGEEFTVILPETSVHQAVEVAERIREAIAATAVTHNDRIFFISASIGVSEYKSGDTEETLLNRADQAMYTAKEAGRNRVCPEP